MSRRNARLRAGASPARRQRGIVVLIALIVMVAMSLAAVGLMRAVDTASMVAGNVAFRQSAQSVSAAAVERALYDMLPPSGTITVTTTDLTKNYYAFVQPGANAVGVPLALQDIATNYPPSFTRLTDGSGNVAYYVIERMCMPPAEGLPASAKYCEMIPPKQSLGMTANKKIPIVLPLLPYYRLTIRVDGPNNSVAFNQAMIR